jgi:hypothetical protein
MVKGGPGRSMKVTSTSVPVISMTTVFSKQVYCNTIAFSLGVSGVDEIRNFFTKVGMAICALRGNSLFIISFHKLARPNLGVSRYIITLNSHDQ